MSAQILINQILETYTQISTTSLKSAQDFNARLDFCTSKISSMQGRGFDSVSRLQLLPSILKKPRLHLNIFHKLFGQKKKIGWFSIGLGS